MSDNPMPEVRRRRCYLVRHGQVSYFDAAGRPLDPRSVPLSAAGQAQAGTLAEHLREAEIDRALCSDYPRARQTLELLLAGRRREIEETPALREIRAGRLREIPAECLQQEVTLAYRLAGLPGAAFLRGEPWVAFQERVLEFFFALLAEPDWDSALIVSHDAVNRVLLAWASGIGLQGLAAFEQDNACLNVLDIDMQGDQVLQAIVRTQNFTPYDPAKVAIRHTVMEHLYHAIDPRGLLA